MLLPNQVDYLIRKERYDEFVRQAEKDRLIRLIRPNLLSPTQQRLVRWIGFHMIRWGLKLRRYGMTPRRRLA